MMPGFADHCGGTIVEEAEVDGLVLRHEADPARSAPRAVRPFPSGLHVTLRGRRIARRCFVASATKLILPAFGALTGGLDAAHPAIVRAAGRRRRRWCRWRTGCCASRWRRERLGALAWSMRCEPFFIIVRGTITSWQNGGAGLSARQPPGVHGGRGAGVGGNGRSPASRVCGSERVGNGDVRTDEGPIDGNMRTVRAPRLHQHRRGQLRRRRRRGRADPAGQPDEPLGRRARARLDRGRSLADPAGPGDQDHVAQAAGVHPQPDAQGDRRGQRRADPSLRDPQTLAERTKEGKHELADHAGRLHPSRLRAAGRRRGRGAGRFRRLFLPVPRLALRYRRAHPQGPGTEEPASCRNMRSSPTPSSRSAEG